MLAKEFRIRGYMKETNQRVYFVNNFISFFKKKKKKTQYLILFFFCLNFFFFFFFRMIWINYFNEKLEEKTHGMSNFLLKDCG